LGAFTQGSIPEKRKSKLQPQADGPFKVLRKINNNAYEIDLPNTYGVSTSFNVADLSPYFGLEESRMTPFQEGEDDEDIPVMTIPSSTTATRDQVIEGPIMRSRAKKLQQQVNSLHATFDASIDENVKLPKCSTLIVLRNMQQEDAESDSKKEPAKMDQFGFKTDQFKKSS
jgi:hypothetical protein